MKSRILAVTALMILAACPYHVTGHIWRVTADVSPEIVETIRDRVFSLGGLDGPIQVTGSPCTSAVYYEKRMKHSGIRFFVYDCYYEISHASKTGGKYFVAVQLPDRHLTTEVQNHVDAFVEEIRQILQLAVGAAKVSVTQTKTGYGFSLLPY